MPTKKLAKPRAKKKEYVATLSLYGKNYIGVGENLLASISDIDLKHPPRARGVLTVQRGEAEKSRILTPFQIQKLFSLSPLMREIQLKNIITLFDL